MTWVKLDDQFRDHPKIIKAGPMAAWLWVCGLSYCSEHLTDGLIPRGVLRMLADLTDVEAQAERLVEVGLWERTEDGYSVHDYLVYQPAGDQVRAERSAARERMQRLRSGELHPNNQRSSSSPSPSPSPSPLPVPQPEPVMPVDTGSLRAECAEVFALYKAKVQPQALSYSPAKIKARLKRFGAEKVVLAIEHFAADWWQMQNNAHRGADWFFHNDQRVEQYINMKPRALPETRDGMAVTYGRTSRELQLPDGVR